jgi:replicative DNA helicase
MLNEPMVQDLNFQAISERMPPQNIDAEEAILGGILMDPEAIGRITDILLPAAFYISAHRQIFEAALALHAQNKPTDLMNLAIYLRDQGKLDALGGQNRLVELADRTVSAVNIDQYALLVMQKYLRRKLIKVGHEISDLGHDTTQDFELVLDAAEQKVFSITQSRPQDGLVSTAEVLTQTFSDIETRSVGLALPGLACGYYDLDAMTQGFQRSDLIIVAGRPSMGKTSFVLNIARNVASQHKLPVAVFSLEMSKEQLVQRLLAGEVRIESSRLRAGRIAQNEWEPLAHSIGQLSEMPIFLDDTPGISVSEMRSRVRRLQAEQGGGLGLVVIDYLQLMESKGVDNRVQALSSITRSLKGLARELMVPVIALSQLSRGVEARTDKRPMMSDLRESGAIEQDADLIMMLYRDEYYNKDSPDRGLAEVIISKHRNGPVGTVKLLFEPQFTQFRNLAAAPRDY